MSYFFSPVFWKDCFIGIFFTMLIFAGIYVGFLQPQLHKHQALKKQYEAALGRENAAIAWMKIDMDHQAALEDLTALFPVLYGNMQQLTNINQLCDAMVSIFKSANLVIVHFGQRKNEKKVMFHVVLRGTYEDFYSMMGLLKAYEWPIKIEAFAIQKQGVFDMRLVVQGF